MILFPFLGWLAILTSIAMFVLLVASGDLGGRPAAIRAAWFAAATWAQFFSSSAVIAAAGLGLQTLLAISLIVRWRLQSHL